MNGKIKFHKANGPAFLAGERWEGSSGIRCTIVSTRKFGEGKHDYEVTYQFSDGQLCTKDAWSFQVRYQHVADKAV